MLAYLSRFSLVSGLEHLIEYQDENPSLQLMYACSLCEIKLTSENLTQLLQHLTGFKHRLNYLVSFPTFQQEMLFDSQIWSTACQERDSARIGSVVENFAEHFAAPREDKAEIVCNPLAQLLMKCSAQFVVSNGMQFELL